MLLITQVTEINPTQSQRSVLLKVIETCKISNFSGGKGYAAYFNGTDMSIIKHIPAYESREFTVTFWIFLLPGNMEGIRTILHKGSRPQEMTPTIQLWPKDDTRLHVRTSTDELSNDGLDSNSYLPMRKWTHVTVSYSNELLQLYIDGLLDSQTILHGHIKVWLNSSSINFLHFKRIFVNLLD